MISIVVLFLLGVASSRHISYYDGSPHSRPMITQQQERRICAELCMAGLGGEPCGADCLDVIPEGLPSQASQSSEELQVDYTRKDACPVLCANRLGYPLCNCTYAPETRPFFRIDFVQICSHFCLAYKYQIYGCNTCDAYKNMTGISTKATPTVYNWNSWCLSMCQEGDGGSACYCDLLPMGLKLD
ncbi:uncharacterized protein LOC123010837 isoform X2 [Tribolium madens]|uniref:uncharacterized protein LOC123010837 isoform X2 n=1 Tax=Tribolium madens TaxID=41895 RepID=UPI001CF76712|nr:uncharacterized protein LOC123010837 isoform X2 [Tribolium madens]